MTASVSDHFRQPTSGTRPEAAYLSAQKTIGASSISINVATGWATDTGIDLLIYRKDANGDLVAGTVTTWLGTLSGTTISDLTLKAGTDQAYASGEQSVVIMSVTAAWGKSLVDGILIHADQDGTLKAGAVDNAAVLASDVVTTAKIAAASITNAKLATSTGEIGAAWQSWTPTWTNFTIGNGVNNFKYQQVGKIVHIRGYVTLGSTSSMGTNPTLTLPVAALDTYKGTASGSGTIGMITVEDNSTTNFQGGLFMETTTVVRPSLHGATGTYISQVGITASAPMTWTTGDELRIVGTYEAA